VIVELEKNISRLLKPNLKIGSVVTVESFFEQISLINIIELEPNIARE